LIPGGSGYLIPGGSGYDKGNNKTQWTKFTYTGKETRVITTAFKNSNVKATLTTNNTLSKLLKTNHHRTKHTYENSGIYQLTCPSCNKKYIGQTRSPFTIRFQEHFTDFKYRNNKSSFAQHLIKNGHSIGPMEDIMKSIHVTTKGYMMDTVEKYYIFRETKINNQINDRLTVQPNTIFETIVKYDPYRGLPSAYGE
jgi:hypothetical protein